MKINATEKAKAEASHATTTGFTFSLQPSMAASRTTVGRAARRNTPICIGAGVPPGHLQGSRRPSIAPARAAAPPEPTIAELEEQGHIHVDCRCHTCTFIATPYTVNGSGTRSRSEASGQG
jgi:hypothetical protein